MIHQDTFSYERIHRDTMSSNIKVIRVCEHCGNSFEAKTTVTRYCSHRCNSRAYKSKTRGGKIEKSNTETLTRILLPIEALRVKEYLNINETCSLIGISRMTLYRLIKGGQIKAANIGRKVIIKRSEIDRLMK